MDNLEEIETQLSKILGKDLYKILEGAEAEYGSANSFYQEIPNPNDVDLPVEVLAVKVAQMSNNFGKIAQLAGKARANVRIAEGRYKQAYKTAISDGRNEAAREADKQAAAEKEYKAYTLALAFVELVESAELAARIASESARKLLDKADTIRGAHHREDYGASKVKEPPKESDQWW